MKKKRSARKKITKIKIILIPLLLLVAFFCILIFFSFDNNSSTYSQEFIEGKKVYFYNPKGVFEFYDGKTTQLISENVMSYGNPVLSPDNTKVAYYTGDAPYNLFIYDITNKSSKELASDVNLYPGYLQVPVWSEDSQGVYVSFQEDGNNLLYYISLDGKKVAQGIKTSIYWPQIVDKNTIAYNIALPNTYSVGVMRIPQNTNTVFTTNATTYFTKVKKIKDKIVNIGNPGLSSEGATNNQTVYGLNTLDLSTGQTIYFQIPNNVERTERFKRIQPLVSCDESIILGSVVDAATTTSLGEAYNAFYSYDPLNKKSVKILESQNVETLQTLSSPRCTGEYMYYSDINTATRINYFNLKTNKLSTIDFFQQLPQNVKTGIQKQCLYASVEYISGFSDDSLAFISVNPTSNVNSQNCEDLKNNTGIYRIGNNTTLKVADSTIGDIFQQSFLLPPLNSQN